MSRNTITQPLLCGSILLNISRCQLQFPIDIHVITIILCTCTPTSVTLKMVDELETLPKSMKSIAYTGKKNKILYMQTFGETAGETIMHL